MKALTVMQPWASAITAGIKSVENRNWCTRYRGPIAIHAGLSNVPLGDLLWAYRDIFVHELGDLHSLPVGVLLGVVDIVDCVRYSEQPELHLNLYASGPWCWMLENSRALPEPIPWKGKQGLWNVPDKILRRVL